MAHTVIVYASQHHGNTKKLAESLAEKYGIPLIDASLQPQADLSGYDLIGFASGIDFGNFYPSILQFLQENLPVGKRVFFLYTSAKISSRFTKQIREEALKKGALILGEYGCRGYNTYGPWKLIGGMNKQHPNQSDCDEAAHFYDSILAECPAN